MCVIAFAWQVVPGHNLVLISNRDEDLDRPTSPASTWPISSSSSSSSSSSASAPFLPSSPSSESTSDQAEIFAGRDLVSGGTWLGISRRTSRDPSGYRVAAITNVRHASASVPESPVSRGELVRSFLESQLSVAEYLAGVAYPRYAGFNLLVATAEQLGYCTNFGSASGWRLLPPGFYGLSNASLDTPWPRVIRAKQLLSSLLHATKAGDSPSSLALQLIDMFADRHQPADDQLPVGNGESLEFERTMGPIFVDPNHLHRFATRATTCVLWKSDGSLLLHERAHAEDGSHSDAAFELPANIR